MTNTIVASVLIENDDGKFLLVNINKDMKGGVWVPPGGKVEFGESARETCVREAKEELNIDVKIIEFIGVSEVDYGDGKPWIFLTFSGDIVGGKPELMEEGKTIDFGYFSRNRISNSKNIHWFKK